MYPILPFLRLANIYLVFFVHIYIVAHLVHNLEQVCQARRVISKFMFICQKMLILIYKVLDINSANEVTCILTKVVVNQTCYLYTDCNKLFMSYGDTKICNSLKAVSCFNFLRLLSS